MTKLAINIDMGATNNGVFVAKIKDDKIISKEAFNVKIEEKSLNFSKKDRTAVRHAKRNNQREKLAKRLLDEIININNFSFDEKNLLHGLLKNRGFNYFNIDFDLELDLEVVEKLNQIENFEFKDCVNLEDFEREISKKLENFANLQEATMFLNSQKELLKSQKQDEKDLKNAKKSLMKLFDSVSNEVVKNNKHRKSYFKDIKALLNEPKYQNIISKTKFSADEFYNLVCNISNLQLRILRRYFNEKSPNNTKFDDKKLKDKIQKYLNFTTFKSDDEKSNKKAMLQVLQNGSLYFLTTLNPLVSIPPYESLNNKNPQICNALVIKNELSSTLKNTLEKILAHDEFSRILINEFGEVLKFDNLNDKEIKTIFQRFLDISKGSLSDENEKLYPRELDKNAEIFKREIGLSHENFVELKNFATKYYDEIALAKKGLLQGQILEPCGLHTPHKNNLKDEHISALFMQKFTQNEIANLENFLKNNKFVNNKNREVLLKGFFERLSTTFKAFQNDFYHKLENNDSDADIQYLLNNYKFVIAKITEHNKDFKFGDNKNSDFNKLLQIANIIFDDAHGFNKTCKIHTIENDIRNFGEVAMASRLASNSAKLINGRIEMLLDRITYEIVKKLDLNEVSDIDINVEMNKFDFEKSAKEITGTKQSKSSKKRTQINENKNLICPYSDEQISLQTCEFDHILPRSKELFNSKANLIPVSATANLQKSDKKVFLDDLKPKYLDSIFKKCNVKNLGEFKEFIAKTMEKIDEKTYTNFDNLSSKEQIAFRHALFLENSDKSFQKAEKMLKKDKTKVVTNGTQKRFIALLVQKIKQKNKNINFSCDLINSQDTSATRKDFAKINSEIKKQEFQDSHSHCIDAMVVFYLSKTNQNTDKTAKFDYFDEIYLSQSDLISPKAKTYLELIQKNKNISSKPLFKDSIYSLEFDSSNLKDKEKEILFNLGVLFIKKDGKKQICDQIPQDKFFINTHKIFEKIFEASKNVDFLKKIKFLDSHLKKYIKKDIFDIFFDKKENLKNELKDIEKQPKNIGEFFEILKQNEDKIYDIFTQDDEKTKKILNKEAVKKLFIDKFYTQKQKSQKRARNKKRVTYSLKTLTNDGNYVVRRNGGFECLANEKIATKNYFSGSDIFQTSFRSKKNVLPIKISDILDILNLPKNAEQIYKVPITKKLPIEILNLTFFLAEKSRHQVFVSFDKSKMDCDFSFTANELNSKNEKFKKFCDEFLNGKLKDFLGKPRELKANLIKNDNKVLSLSYKVATSKANKDLIIQELL